MTPMEVAALMSRDVEFIAPDATVQQAAEMMGELDVGALPVGKPEDLLGIVTDRDILYRVVAEGDAPTAIRVRDIMTSPVTACRPGDSVQTAMDLMAAQNIRRLAVRDAEERVVGWVTLADLSRRLMLDNEALQQALREVTEASA
ncbi:CBS domain-containing protein [Teichococcus vastitatis]|jgi:CBS domain-containing protein|uniref:CBS domain-containing protein n=1 Tax=Teichococcus vastitatis TaxID=2307076 RepID=A0ABS9WCH7_9PROT|nr:CBS domain-containing protein [Pseudoroseomonas vastitatis]MCI0757009.1 CBS domain-containing protein [Pseudoroseomonas vastitatis]